MINSYLTDTITIITSSLDEWGKETTTEQTDINAKIEDTNKIITDGKGKEVVGNMFLLVEKTATLTYNSRIKIITKGGEATLVPNKEFIIKKLSSVVGWTASHWEVYL